MIKHLHTHFPTPTFTNGSKINIIIVSKNTACK